MAKKAKEAPGVRTATGNLYKEWKNFNGKVEWYNHPWVEAEAQALMDVYETEPEAMWELADEALHKGFRLSVKFDTYTGVGFVATISCMEPTNSLHKVVISERASGAAKAQLKALYVLAHILSWGDDDLERPQDVLWF